MKVFVWKRIAHCTEREHSEGGVVVFADNEERARELANAEHEPLNGDQYYGRRVYVCRILPDEQPDEIRGVSGGEEAVYIMPDAGCC